MSATAAPAPATGLPPTAGELPAWEVTDLPAPPPFGFRNLMTVRHKLGVARDDQQRRELRGHVVDFACPEAAQIELVEVSVARQAEEADPHERTRCIIFSQNKT